MDIYQKSRRESFRLSFIKKFSLCPQDKMRNKSRGQEQGFCGGSMWKEEEEKMFNQQQQEGKQHLPWPQATQQEYILDDTFRESGQVSDLLHIIIWMKCRGKHAALMFNSEEQLEVEITVGKPIQ